MTQPHQHNYCAHCHYRCAAGILITAAPRRRWTRRPCCLTCAVEAAEHVRGIAMRTWLEPFDRPDELCC